MWGKKRVVKIINALFSIIETQVKLSQGSFLKVTKN